MNFSKLSAIAALFTGAAMLVTGCAPTGGTYDLISELSPENSLLRFYGKPLKDATPQRAVFANPWEYEEYAGFQGKEMRLEMFYIHQVGWNTVVQYPYTMRHMIDAWNYNSGQNKRWEIEEFVNGPVAEIWYQRYVLSDRNQACAGFQAEWDYDDTDLLSRPGKVFFGYLCAAPGKQLADAAIEDALTSIGIRGVTERIRKGDPAQLAMDFGDTSKISAPTRHQGLAIARGGADGTTGSQGFPFGFVEPYTEGDGGDEPIT
ncbi:MAG: hypothetical protein QF654_09160 [Alphaproteobacteria bacterium]|nr:hypothetical protein [Alphaproteobacteria bacterium]